jgi:two-component system, NarL family, invasion response regulator UvrY
MKRILIVDDHPMFRQGLVNSLQQGIGAQQISCDEAGCGEDALALIAEQSYDLAIVDISMPGMGGLALLEALRQTAPQLPVLMLSMFSEEQFALKAFRLGAAGYLTKREAADELTTAVNQIMSGKRYLSQPLSNALIEQAMAGEVGSQPSHAAPSGRELEILQRLAAGQSLKFIAIELNLSIKTVSTYKSRLYAKMGFRSMAGLMNYATTHDLL